MAAIGSPGRGVRPGGARASTVRADHATFTDPHQYATGVRDVVVNGVAALRDGESTGALPGRAVYGPGKRT